MANLSADLIARDLQEALALAKPPELRSESENSLVFVLDTERIARVHRHDRAWQQERIALREWTPALGDLAPQLVEEVTELKALVMSFLQGRHAPAAISSPEAWRNVVEEVGVLLATLHAEPEISLDPMPVERALTLRAIAWLGRARSHGEPDLLRVAEALADTSCFAGERRVPCHRDNQARNWLVEDGSLSGLVDFEHCRPDHWMVDLVKLPDEVPGLEEREILEVFLRGYGSPECLDDPAFEPRWRWLRTLHGLATLTWGNERGDVELQARGRAILGALVG